MTTTSPPRRRLRAVQLDAVRLLLPESDLPTNRLLEKLPYTRYRAERRDLLRRNAMFVCYSWQEYQTAANRFVTSHFVEQIIRGCGADVSEALGQADHDSFICLIGRHLDADLRGK